MRNSDKLKTIETTLEIKGHSIPVTVTIEISNDDWPEGDFDFGSEDENQKYMKRFESGELLCLSVLIKATGERCEGWDALGMCHVRSTFIEQDVEELVKEHSMIETAVTELKNNILSTAKQLQKYA